MEPFCLEARPVNAKPIRRWPTWRCAMRPRPPCRRRSRCPWRWRSRFSSKRARLAQRQWRRMLGSGEFDPREDPTRPRADRAGSRGDRQRGGSRRCWRLGGRRAGGGGGRRPRCAQVAMTRDGRAVVGWESPRATTLPPRRLRAAVHLLRHALEPRCARLEPRPALLTCASCSCLNPPFVLAYLRALPGPVRLSLGTY